MLIISEKFLNLPEDLYFLPGMDYGQVNDVWLCTEMLLFGVQTVDKGADKVRI